MKRRDFISLLGGATAWPLAARAQQVTKIPRMGVLTPGRSDSSDASLRTLNAFMSALPELGYTEGQNIAIERKFGEGHADRLRGLATELVERQVDVIVVFSTPAARAAKQATTTIPIVAIAMADPVADELVASLAQPGGNVTGTAFLGPELVSKRLQLLREIVPGLSRVAVLWHPSAYAEPSPILFGLYPGIVTLAANNRLPAMYAAREGVELGGLSSYGVNLPDLARATAIYLGKILKGAKPAELPVQQPTKFELVINLKTAQALGLSVPLSLQQRADELIE